LITAATSVQPIPAGRYIYGTNDERGPIQLQKFPGGGYIYQGEEEVMPLLVYPVSDNWYVLQFGEEGLEPLLYGVGRLEEDRLTIYDPVCDDEIAAVEGVTMSNADCRFLTLNGLVAASSIIADRVEAGDQTDWHGWTDLKRISDPETKQKQGAIVE
jgi:hypothetical protein